MQPLDDGEIAVPFSGLNPSITGLGHEPIENLSNTELNLRHDRHINGHAHRFRNRWRQPSEEELERDERLKTLFSLPSSTLITGELLLNFQRCKRRAFLDKYASPSDRDETSDYLRKLQQDSFVHQRNVLSVHSTQSPDYPSRQWDEGFLATLELMRQGVSHIERGVLLAEYPQADHSLALADTWRQQALRPDQHGHVHNASGRNGSGRNGSSYDAAPPGSQISSSPSPQAIAQDSNPILLVSRPKLLVRRPGPSAFGDWYYVSADIKLGKRPKADYQVVAAFHSYLLFLIQETWPDKSSLILRYGNEYRIKMDEQVPKMQSVLENCIDMIVEKQEPSVFISRNRCDLCHWFSHCYSVAHKEAHLSLLPGVTPSRYAHLKSLNLTTVESLAKITSPSLASLPGFGQQTAHKLVRQAQSTYHSKALKLSSFSGINHPPLDQWIPSAPVELYFDIEAAPERELIYLHGVVVVDRDAQTETFHALMAESPEEEEAIWHQFLELTARYPTAPIFHFCPYEAQMVKKLGGLYQTPEVVTEELLRRFVDLHDRVIHTVTMPIESYALKAIAKWVGFDWRDSGANGAQSIFWYDQWLETGDRAYLESILRYNEDDCRATWQVKDWLVNFLESADE